MHDEALISKITVEGKSATRVEEKTHRQMAHLKEVSIKNKKSRLQSLREEISRDFDNEGNRNSDNVVEKDSEGLTAELKKKLQRVADLEAEIDGEVEELKVHQALVEQEESVERSAEAEESSPYRNMSLEELVKLITYVGHLTYLQDKTRNELEELKQRQSGVAELHNILKAIDAASSDKGELDISENDELKTKLDRARELGCDIKGDKFSFNREERERLVDGIRMTVDDLTTQNDMQLQIVSRLTNERYETIQMVRSILKPLHESKISNARAIKGG